MNQQDLRLMFIFPGQGSQYKGMGEDLYAEFASARKIYDRAGEVLGYDIKEMSFRDPQGQLDKTRFTQPALLTHEIACLEVLRELTGNAVAPAVTAGHSLGEYSALVAGGALSFENGLKLVKRRGEVLSEHGRGKMAAIRTDVESVRPYAEQHYCGIAGINLPEQTVVGGMEPDLQALTEHMKKEKGTKGIVLNVEGAYHTYIMAPAAGVFKTDLVGAEFNPPKTKVLSNYRGDFHASEPDAIRACLFFQLFHPVKWISCMEKAFQEKIHAVIELGGGIGSGEGPAAKRPNLASITDTLMKKFAVSCPYKAGINTATLKDIPKFLQELAQTIA